MKKIRKSEVIDMENDNERDEFPEENVTAVAGKTKWTLKKKLMIGGGILAGLVLGAVALSTKKAVPANDQTVDSGDDYEEASGDAAVSEDNSENGGEFKVTEI